MVNLDVRIQDQEIQVRPMPALRSRAVWPSGNSLDGRVVEGRNQAEAGEAAARGE
jgi:hypothetical protein